jgi:hypothetical protein
MLTSAQDLGNKLKDAMGGESHVIIELDWKDSMLNPDERWVTYEIPIRVLPWNLDTMPNEFCVEICCPWGGHHSC